VHSVLESVAPWAVLVVGLGGFLWLDLHFFARGGEPSFREGALWSLGWLVLSLVATFAVLAFRDGEDALLYTTVYLIERSLSLDNLFVFLLLFAYFGIPFAHRPRLLLWGIVGALALRAAFIAVGVTLIEQFEPVLYVLGALLVVLAYRILRGVQETVDPDRNLLVRIVRRLYPVTDGLHGNRWFVNVEGRRYTTPLFLCLVAIMFADLAFAIDSIPAAFAITRDPLIIWMGNVFALLGLRALFVLVEDLIARFRFLDQTIAVVLGLIGLELLLEDVVHVGPVANFGLIAGLFTAGIVASMAADRRDPEAMLKREERRAKMRPGGAARGEPEPQAK
jgi:tellurite resistance protein TerC